MTMALSRLGHTWLIDIDGTLLKHNGYKAGGDELLPGVQAFWQSIPANDCIILLSAREECYRAMTLDFLRAAGLRFDQAIFGLPHGERLLLNDTKPRGLQTAIALNLERDAGLTGLAFTISDAP